VTCRTARGCFHSGEVLVIPHVAPIVNTTNLVGMCKEKTGAHKHSTRMHINWSSFLRAMLQARPCGSRSTNTDIRRGIVLKSVFCLEASRGFGSPHLLPINCEYTTTARLLIVAMGSWILLTHTYTHSISFIYIYFRIPHTFA
jgi:hypothetical protein